jgi:hypothetical protein
MKQGYKHKRTGRQTGGWEKNRNLEKKQQRAYLKPEGEKMMLVPFYHKIEEICCEGKVMGFPFLPR